MLHYRTGFNQPQVIRQKRRAKGVTVRGGFGGNERSRALSVYIAIAPLCRCVCRGHGDEVDISQG